MIRVDDDQMGSRTEPRFPLAGDTRRSNSRIGLNPASSARDSGAGNHLGASHLDIGAGHCRAIGYHAVPRRFHTVTDPIVELGAIFFGHASVRTLYPVHHHERIGCPRLAR